MRPPRFDVGAQVRVLDLSKSGHIRTPRYCRGHVGTIERVCGQFPNPEELAYGNDGLPAQTLYRVRFPQRSLWPEYQGPETDNIEIEIYDHWLDPVIETKA